MLIYASAYFLEISDFKFKISDWDLKFRIENRAGLYGPELMNFLVIKRTGKRLIPFRTQKLSPCGRW